MYNGNRGGDDRTLHFMTGANIATVFVDVDSSVKELCEDKERKAEGSIEAYDKRGYCILKQNIKFGGHGKSSFIKNDKKSWNIKLERESSLLGLAKGETYVAISNAQDVTYMRNKIVFDMADHAGLFYTPQGEYANMYINGEYMGLYLMAERIEASDERVALENVDASQIYTDHEDQLTRYDIYEEKGYIFPETAEEPERISFLMKEDTEDDGRYDSVKNGFIANEEAMFQILSPKYVSQQQISKVKAFMEALLDGIASEDGYCQNEMGDAVHYLNIIDADSFVKKYLIEEIAKNYDGNIRSSYYYISSLDENGKIFAGPVWDYDLAFGNCQNSVEWNCPQGIVKYRPGLDLREEFQIMAIQYYADYFFPYLNDEIEKNIDRYAKELDASVKMDQIRWQGNPMWRTDFEEGVTELVDFIRARKQFLNDVWLKGMVYHRVNFVDGDKVVKSIYIQDGEYLDTSHRLQKDSYQFLGWYDEDLEKEWDFEQPVTDNMALWAKWDNE